MQQWKVHRILLNLLTGLIFTMLDKNIKLSRVMFQTNGNHPNFFQY